MPQKGMILWEKAPNPRDFQRCNGKMIVSTSILIIFTQFQRLIMEKTFASSFPHNYLLESKMGINRSDKVGKLKLLSDLSRELGIRIHIFQTRRLPCAFSLLSTRHVWLRQDFFSVICPACLELTILHEAVHCTQKPFMERLSSEREALEHSLELMRSRHKGLRLKDCFWLENCARMFDKYRALPCDYILCPLQKSFA